jgi:hypothetical protein
MPKFKNRHVAAYASAVLFGANATPAFAEWETITDSPREETSLCKSEHTSLMGRIRNDGTPVGISAGYHGQIEIYGHFIDVSPSASISGTGGSGIEQPKITDRRGGAENGPRRCGVVGSVVVEIDIPENAQVGPALLTVGNERIPLTIRKPFVSAMLWAEQSLSGGSIFSRSAPSASSSSGTSSPSSPPPPPPTFGGSTAGCSPNGSGCRQDTGIVIVGGSSSGQSGRKRLTLPPAIGGCIEELGGKLEMSDRTMTITLPTNRQASGVQECLKRPIYLNLDLSGPTGPGLDGYGRMSSSSIPEPGGVMPRRTYEIPTFSGIAGFASPQVNSTYRDFFELYLPEEVREDFVGITNKQIRISSASLTPLTLTIRSNPLFGINTILPWPNGRTRIGLKIPMKFDFNTAPGQAVTTRWRVRGANGGNASACFTDTVGTVTTNRLINDFDLTLKPETTCETQRFFLDITVVDPALPSSDPFVAPYMRSMAFVPGPATAIIRPTAPTMPNPRTM